MPDQHVGVPGVAVYVGDEGVEPDDGCAKVGRGLEAGGRIEAQGAGQEVEAHVEAAAPLEQFPDLGVGLGGRQTRVEVDEHDLGDEQPEGATDLTGNQLGHQGLLAVAGATELGDVQAVVVCLDHRR